MTTWTLDPAKKTVLGSARWVYRSLESLSLALTGAATWPAGAYVLAATNGATVCGTTDSALSTPLTGAGTATLAGAIYLKTDELLALFGTAGNRASVEVSVALVNSTSGARYALGTVTIYEDGYDTGTATVSGSPDYYTAAQVDALLATVVAWPTADGSALADANRFAVGQLSGAVWTWVAKTGTQVKAWLAGTYALLAHGHTGTTDGSKLAQANTHESADTDSATTALHHTLGTGANQALPGNTSIPVLPGVASTSALGMAPQVTAPGSGLLSVLAVANGETVRTDKALFDTTNPAALGSAGPGTQLVAARRDHVHAMPGASDVAAAAYSAVSALPGSPVAGTLYRLTAADNTALAAPGWYSHDGTGWVCHGYYAPYALGNWQGTTVKALIPGLDYSATVSGNLTAGWGITMARAGTVRVRATNAASSVALPAGTTKMRGTGAMADLAAALAEWLVTNDGTTQDWSAKALVTTA
jgi:hypothetical protein